MAEYIERQKVFDSLPVVTEDKSVSLYGAVADFMVCVSAIQSADVAPVRHGRWIDKPTGRYGQWQAWCSVCDEKCGCGGTIESQHKIFCPNCGAKMDLEV